MSEEKVMQIEHLKTVQQMESRAEKRKNKNGSNYKAITRFRILAI